MTIAELPLNVVRVFAAVFGLLWGSFLNVVIYRAPRELSVVRPGSACPACGKPIEPWNNIPVVSFVLQRGRARCCGVKMSPRYLVVELLGGALSLAIVEALVRQLGGGESAARAGMIYLADFTLCMGLLAAAFIDAEHMYLPETITLGGTVLGLGTPSFRELGYTDALVGAAAGFLGVWLPFVFLYRRLAGRAGMGMGDAKLTMLAGAWFGWPGAVFVFFAGAMQATVGALVIWMIRGKVEEPEEVKADREELRQAAAEGDEEAQRELEEDPLAEEPEPGFLKARLPFGPFLILAIVEYLFFGARLRELVPLGK